MLLDGSSHRKRKRDQFDDLPTAEQLAHGVRYEEYLSVRERRREATARVRRMNADTAIRVGLFVLAVIIGTVLVIGALGSPVLLKLAAGGATVWGGAVALLLRRDGRQVRDPSDQT